jgi:type IV pilus assembly protein PilF
MRWAASGGGRRMLALAAVALLLAAAAWYFGPWSREWRLSRADLLALDAAVARDPQDGLAWYHLGLRLEEKGAPEQAVGALRQARELRPQDSRAVVALGRALLERNRIDEAFQWLKAAEGANPRSTEPKVLLARLYQRRGSYHRAEEQWRRVLALDPGSFDGWYGLAFCHLMMQQLEPATQAAERARQLRGDDGRVLRLSASIAAAKGEMVAARRYFEKAVALYPADPRAHNDLANFLLTQDRSPEGVQRAAEAVARLQQLQPDYPLLTWHRARLAAFRGDWQTAILELRTTLRQQPGLDEAQFQLADAYHHVGEHAKGDAAMATFRQRSELTRKMEEVQVRIGILEDPKLYFELGRLRRQAGLLTAARESIQEGLRLSPNAPQGLVEMKQLDELERRLKSAP